jgi:hypothetical protein
VGGARIESRVTYHICPELRVGFLGASLEMDSEFGSLKRTYGRRDNGVRVDTVFDLARREIAVEELERFRRFLDHALDQTAIWFGLSSRTKRGPEGP